MCFASIGFLGQTVKFVGAGVEWTWGGDACVAPAGGEMHTQDQDEGDASVPSPHNPTPAPTGTKALPKRHDKKPPLKVADAWGWDAYRGRFFEGKEGRPVGAGVDEVRGGDACVALVGWESETR